MSNLEILGEDSLVLIVQTVVNYIFIDRCKCKGRGTRYHYQYNDEQNSEHIFQT